MTTDIESLIAAAEEASKLWRLGSDKAKRPARDIINDLDAAVSACKRRMARDATTVIHRSREVPPIILE